MSHVVSIACELTDLDAIKAVCKELGLTFKENQKTYQWWGYSAGDYPLPEGFTKEDLGHCEHAIGIPGTNWEVGLARPKGQTGLRLLFDFFGSEGRPILDALGGEKATEFLKRYAACKTELACARAGYKTSRVYGKNSIKVVAYATRTY
jgi:hypothetical protein